MNPYGSYRPTSPPWEEVCPERKQGLKHERTYRDGRPLCVHCGANPEAPWPNPANLVIATIPGTFL